MNDSFRELLVKHKQSSKEKAPGIAVIVLCVLSFIASFIFGMWVLLITVALGVVAYFLYFRRLNVEYEYLYVDKQLTIDRIFNESSRKNVAKYQLTDMEIMAPTKSYRLDDYRKRQYSVKDFSAGVEEPGEGFKNYDVYMSGNIKLQLTLSEEFAKSMGTYFPQKVFYE